MDAQRQGFLMKRLSRFFGYSLLILTSLILIAPVFFMVVSSLKVDAEYLTYPIRVFPKIPQWANYRLVFAMTPFAEIALRTAVLAISVATISAFTSSMIGYAFARYNVPGSKQLFALVIAMLILPFIVILIPQFIVYAKIKLTNTYWPWILGALAGSPFNIFMFRQFFLGFPRELEDAAEIDGCGPFQIYSQIFLPNAQPVIATVMIFTFMGVWGDYLMPSIYLNANKTLLGVTLATAFKNPQGFDLKTISLAASVFYILPMIIVFFLAQKHILKGVVTSGLKG
ncbi:MAG TPA: carbohydrate ABC transporter permease [Anaerolineales bacterium]|nr:carbohydrate ABC transporter permease [Anaerolineales bacterium]